MRGWEERTEKVWEGEERRGRKEAFTDEIVRIKKIVVPYL